MSRLDAFVEYAIPALLRDVLEFDNNTPIISFEDKDLLEILKWDRWSENRRVTLRQLCMDQELGYTVVDGRHCFFSKDLSPRRMEDSEIPAFIETLDDFEAVYGSMKADDIYTNQSYRGIHNPSKKVKVHRVRGG